MGWRLRWGRRGGGDESPGDLSPGDLSPGYSHTAATTVAGDVAQTYELSKIIWVISATDQRRQFAAEISPFLVFWHALCAPRVPRVAKKPLKTNPPPSRCAGEGGRGVGAISTR